MLADAGRRGGCPTRNQRGFALAYFKDDQEVYEYIGKLFEDLADDDDLGPKFRKANTIVQYQYRNPESQITVKMLEGEDGQVDLGPTDLEPEVVMTMDADTAHKFWLGKINVTVALARGQMKAKGPVAKILKLVPLVKPVFPRYKAQLEESGREDLVNVSCHGSRDRGRGLGGPADERVQGLLPVRRADPRRRRPRPARAASASSSRRRARSASSIVTDEVIRGTGLVDASRRASRTAGSRWPASSTGCPRTPTHRRRERCADAAQGGGRRRVPGRRRRVGDGHRQGRRRDLHPRRQSRASRRASSRCRATTTAWAARSTWRRWPASRPRPAPAARCRWRPSSRIPSDKIKFEIADFPLFPRLAILDPEARGRCRRSWRPRPAWTR